MESWTSLRQSSPHSTTLTCRTMFMTVLITTWTLLAISPANAKPSENSPSSSSSSSDGGVVTHYGYYNGGGFYGGAGGGYGMGDSGYMGDFDKEWATISGRIPSPNCVDIPTNLSLCADIGYKEMLLPNLLQHDTLTEVTQQARSWVPLVGLHCHPDTRVFLCSLFSPVCLDREIYPCRSLCENVRDSCLHRMIPYGFDWPEMLRCDKFPMDNDMCIKLIHDSKGEVDNNCAACKHPMTYEAIIDNYCRAEFVSRVKIESKEPRGQDQALVLKKSKRYYKKENITKKERSGMTPLIVQGSSCQCDAITDTSKRYLLMGAHRGEDLVVNYVVEFQRKDKDFRKAFKDIRKGNVCNTIIQELSAGDIEKNTEKDKDDGVCNACRMPLKYNTMVENYCLADFVLRVKVKGLEARDSHQALVLKKSRKNFKKGAISRKEEKAMVPLLDGREGCTCELVNNDKSRYLIFGNKRDDQYYITYVIEFAKRDPEFKKALRAIRKHTACLGILQGTGLGVDPEDDATDDKKKGKGKKRRKKGKKGKKGRKGKKKRKDKKAKKSASAENSDNSA